MRIIEGIIREIDLECACLSILVQKSLISEELFLDLKEGDKESRNILIGNLQRVSEEAKNSINEGIGHYVDVLIRSLKSPKNVLEVAKDAIFTLNDIPNVFKLDDYINFVVKNKYNILIEIDIVNGKGDNNGFVKLYKNADDLVVRYGSIDTDHPAYVSLYELLDFKINNNSKMFYRILPKFKRFLDMSDKRLINVLDNNYLYDIIVDIM